MAYTTINKSSDYFNTVLYTGDGSNSRTVTGVGFQPDFSWLKNRSNTTPYSNQTFDSVRGTSAGTLYTDLQNAEDTNYPISSFDSDGVTLRATSHDSQNGNNDTFVMWNWLAGGTASSNTDGATTSSVSANTTSGFSIVSYTGTGVGNTTTVGHGLGSAPDVIIVKCKAEGRGWIVYSSDLGATKKLDFDTNTAVSTSSSNWNDTDPTSTVFTVGTGGDTNSDNGFIAYCFKSIKGFSKFGTFLGNASEDGPMIHTGFKPAMVIVKNTSIVQHWSINDNKRDPYNVMSKRLYPSQPSAEATSSAYYMDYLSNGFKIRSTSASWNGSGNTMFYMAFAENPFVTSTGLATTAR